LGDIVDGDGEREGSPGKQELEAIMSLSKESKATVYHVPGEQCCDSCLNSEGNHDFYIGGMTKAEILKQLGAETGFYVIGEWLGTWHNIF
jgi:hypothetical protein